MKTEGGKFEYRTAYEKKPPWKFCAGGLLYGILPFFPLTVNLLSYYGCI